AGRSRMVKFPLGLSSRAYLMAASRVRKSPARRPVVSRMTHVPRELTPSKKYGEVAVDNRLGKSMPATRCRDMTRSPCDSVTATSYVQCHINSSIVSGLPHKGEI